MHGLVARLGGMSVGMAQSATSQAEFDALLSAADMAMRRVKKRGGNGFEMANHLLDLPSASHKGTEHNVILGLERHQFHQSWLLLPRGKPYGRFKPFVIPFSGC